MSADEDEPPIKDDSRLRTVTLAVLVEGGLVALALLLGWLFDKQPLSRLELDSAGVGWGLLAALPMLAAFFVMHRWPVGPLAGLKKFSETTVRPMMLPLTVR